MDLTAEIKNALLELKAHAAGNTLDNVEEKMREAGILFLGNKLSTVLSIEVFHYMKSHRGLDVDGKLATKLIPGICRELGMKTKAYILAEDSRLPNPEIASYDIDLF